MKYRPHGMLAPTDALHNYVPLATRAVISVTRPSINAFPLLSFSQSHPFVVSQSKRVHVSPPPAALQGPIFSQGERERQVDMGGKRMGYESVREGAREALTLTRLLVK